MYHTIVRISDFGVDALADFVVLLLCEIFFLMGVVSIPSQVGVSRRSQIWPLERFLFQGLGSVSNELGRGRQRIAPSQFLGFLLLEDWWALI